MVVQSAAMARHKSVLMTSPGGGIGQALFKHFIANDYQIIAVGGSQSKDFIENYGDGKDVSFIPCDYFDPNSMEQAIAKSKEKVSRIDAFIHLTGGSLFSKPAGEINISDFKKVVDLNLTSAFVLGQEVFNWMKNAGGGNMIFFGSTTGIVPSFKKLPYAVSKAGLHMLARVFALEGASYGIIANSIAPGYVLTDRHIQELNAKASKNETDYETELHKVVSKNLMNGTLLPEDLIPIVTLLIETQSITGAIIPVDLGQTTIQ